MPAPLHTPFDVLVAGGGPAAIEAALAIRSRASSATVRVRLLTPSADYVYVPVGVVEPFGGARRTYPLARLAEHAVHVVRDSLAAVDPAARTVTTGSGRRLGYGALLVATGARTRPSLAHAVTFAGPSDAPAVREVLRDLEAGRAERIAFVLPVGAGWTLPLYELALQTAQRGRELGLRRLRITIVTYEARPLSVFGPGVAAPVAELLRASGIAVVTGAQPAVVAPGRVAPGSPAAAIEVDRVVAMPVPAGRAIPGLPRDGHGFLPVDAWGRVPATPGVYAAGDGTTHRVKQGGLATQQADAAAAALLADAGLAPEGEPYHPVLRGMLLAGERTLFLRREGFGEHVGEASEHPLWWPPVKVAGRHLSPFLDRLDAERPEPTPERRRATAGGAIRRRAIITGRDGCGPLVGLDEVKP